MRLQSPASSQAADIPAIPTTATAMYRRIHTAMQKGLVRACHDLSEGGLAVAAAEMCIGGRLGMDLSGRLDILRSKAAQNIQSSDQILFGETNGCLLVEVSPGDQVAFENVMSGAAFCRLGTLTAEPVLSIGSDGETSVKLAVEQLVRAWAPG